MYAYANGIRILFFLLLLYLVVYAAEKLTGLSVRDSLPEYSRISANVGEEMFFLLIWAPLFEETLFRGFLNLKKEYVWVSVLFLLFGIQLIYYPLLPKAHSIQSISYLILWLFVCAAIGIGLSKVFAKVTDALIAKYIRPNFNFWVYFSMVGFGLVHVTNFEVTNSWHYLLAPLLTVSQLLSGIFLCFVRVNYGLSFSIALHSLDNLFTVIPRLPVEFDKPALALPLFLLIGYLIRRLWEKSNQQVMEVD